jgi:adenylosuccinate lyase
VLLALVERGMSRSEAYDLVQNAARRVWTGDGDLHSHLATDARVANLLAADELASLFDPNRHLQGIEVTFARLGLG